MTKIPTFVKWAGGKKRLILDIDQLLPKKIERYFEPFLGSGAVFFFVKQKRNPSYTMISDKNEEITNAFLVVKNNPKELIKVLTKHKANHSVSYYYKTRSVDPNDLRRIERAGRFIYLNKTCYNGLFRVNSKGVFNVPIGKYKNPNIINENNLLFASSLLKNVLIKQQDFEKIVNFVEKGDFIYFDPCYNPKIRTIIFNKYTKEGFLKNEQFRLAVFFKKLDKKGCLLMESNSNTALVRKLYSGFNIKLVSCMRSINCKSNGRKRIKELIIRNY